MTLFSIVHRLSSGAPLEVLSSVGAALFEKTHKSLVWLFKISVFMPCAVWDQYAHIPSTIRVIHQRFHRIRADKNHEDTSISTNSNEPHNQRTQIDFSLDCAINHTVYRTEIVQNFINNDWKVGLDLLKKSGNLTDLNLQKLVMSLEKILRLSPPSWGGKVGLLFPILGLNTGLLIGTSLLPDPLAWMSALILTGVGILAIYHFCSPQNPDFETMDSFIFSTGPATHAVLFSWEKLDTSPASWNLKVYNSGMGTEREQKGKFLVPSYTIPQKELTALVAEFDKIHEIVEKPSCHGPQLPLWQLYEQAIRKHEGVRDTTFKETHYLQDRGNCPWKCFSTWFRHKCEGMTVAVTPEMAQEAPEYARESFSLLANKRITLNRFFKLIGYEKARFDLKKEFLKQPEDGLEEVSARVRKYARMILYGTPPHLFHYLGSENVGEEYLSSLVWDIMNTNGVSHWDRKETYTQTS